MPSGITVIIVTHEPDIAAYARRKIVFRDGKIIDDSVKGPLNVKHGSRLP